MSSYSLVASAIVDDGGSIFAIHPDIIQNHILTRLDGQTLASTGSTSSQLNKLCTEEKLWTHICSSTWPSTDDRRVRDIISTFPAGHRSFFADSFPSLDHKGHLVEEANHHGSSLPSQFISAVDIHYNKKLIYSKVEVIETETEWFLWSPFRVDLLDTKQSVPTPVMFSSDDETRRSNLDQNLTLSWILIDPTRKRAANLSSQTPVSVERHWLTDDVNVRYTTVLAGGRHVGSSEFVQCSMVVVCGVKERGELHVREVSLHVQDMDGKSLSGRDSLVILQEAMESGRRKKGKRGEERERYEEFMEMRREKRERKQRGERRVDMLCIVSGVTIFMAFWGFILVR